MTNEIYLLLGSNLGNRIESLKKARNLIINQIGDIVRHSNIYQTAPWGETNQPAFLNQVIEIVSNLDPLELLAEIHVIEKKLGRVKKTKWGERIIDIDILYFNDKVLDSANLKIPHSEIENRRFTLVPLVDIAANFIHPILHKTNSELLNICADKLEVVCFETSR